jgi:hypothetical protein
MPMLGRLLRISVAAQIALEAAMDRGCNVDFKPILDAVDAWDLARRSHGGDLFIEARNVSGKRDDSITGGDGDASRIETGLHGQGLHDSALQTEIVASHGLILPHADSEPEKKS